MNYYNQAVKAIEEAGRLAHKLDPKRGSEILDQLEKALSCLAEVAEVYSIETNEDNE